MKRIAFIIPIALVLSIALTGCAVTPEQAQRASDKVLCGGQRNMISGLFTEGRREIERRGLNCDYYDEQARAEEIEGANQRREMQDRQDEQRAKNARAAQEMELLCRYCAKVFPREISERCLNINRFTCGALWDDGRRVVIPESKPSYNCRRVGNMVDCLPY